MSHLSQEISASLNAEMRTNGYYTDAFAYGPPGWGIASRWYPTQSGGGGTNASIEISEDFTKTGRVTVPITLPEYPGVPYFQVMNERVTGWVYRSNDRNIATAPGGSADINAASTFDMERLDETVGIGIKSIRINGSNVNINVTASGFDRGTRRVAVTTGLLDTNNRSVSFEQYVPPGQSTIVLNLPAKNVPRFLSNMKWPIRTDIYDQLNNLDGTDQKIFVVLLPTIIVPGIVRPSFPLFPADHPNGGDGTFPALEGYLRTQSDSLIGGSGLEGEGYRLSTDDTDYPTMATVTYDRLNASFADGAIALGELAVRMLGGTYADKVNLATHSKGGLVARAFVVGAGHDIVNRIVMTAPPNSGSIFASVGSSVGNSGLDNLTPVWNWQQDHSWDIYESTLNVQLQALNQSCLPSMDSHGKAIRYSIIYSESEPTTAAWTWIGTGSFSSMGDEVVTAFSALGYLPDMNIQAHRDNPFLAPRIMAFQNVSIEAVSRSGQHVGYIELGDVMGEILSRICVF